MIQGYDSDSSASGTEETKKSSTTSSTSQINNNNNNNNNNNTNNEVINLKPQMLPFRAIGTAPDINPVRSIALKGNQLSSHRFTNYDTKEINVNVPTKHLYAPIQGPIHPDRMKGGINKNDGHGHGHGLLGQGKKSGAGGIMETSDVQEWSFNEQLNTFNNLGYAENHTTGEIVGDYESAYKNGNVYISSVRKPKRKRTSGGKQIQALLGNNKSGNNNNNAIDGDGDGGPWATFIDPNAEDKRTDAERGILSDAQLKIRAEQDVEKSKRNRPYNEEEDHDRRDERKIGFMLPPRHNRDSTAADVTSVFHGKEEQDYQGRSWVLPEKGTKPSDPDHNCFIPKKSIHKYTGHTKGVQKIEFFPDYGHLLLSAGLDGKVKIWDVYNNRQVRRTYNGHSAAVRDINFRPSDGKTFLSAGFDRYVRLWDTETGQVIQTFTNRKVPYCCKFVPCDENTFLMGCSDFKVQQFDIRENKLSLEYNYHLGPVNTITFYDGGERFMTTSDDKKVLVWEYNTPVPIKYIQEVEMHSMPATTLHPSGQYIAGQSLDNKIAVYSSRGDSVKLNRKKQFRGHMNAGYACQIGFSPNGRFICSGDGSGKIFFWDWRTSKLYSKFQAHNDGPCIGAIWHPREPSWVATCGWDGLIQLWD